MSRTDCLSTAACPAPGTGVTVAQNAACVDPFHFASSALSVCLVGILIAESLSIRTSPQVLSRVRIRTTLSQATARRARLRIRGEISAKVLPFALPLFSLTVQMLARRSAATCATRPAPAIPVLLALASARAFLGMLGRSARCDVRLAFSAYFDVLLQYSNAVTCNSHGTAQSDGSCMCQFGFAQPNCAACSASIALPMYDDDHPCSCADFYGTTCSYCVSSTQCNGNGVCTVSSDGTTYACNCATGFAEPSLALLTLRCSSLCADAPPAILLLVTMRRRLRAAV